MIRGERNTEFFAAERGFGSVMGKVNDDSMVKRGPGDYSTLVCCGLQGKLFRRRLGAYLRIETLSRG